MPPVPFPFLSPYQSIDDLVNSAFSTVLDVGIVAPSPFPDIIYLEEETPQIVVRQVSNNPKVEEIKVLEEKVATLTDFIYTQYCCSVLFTTTVVLLFCCVVYRNKKTKPQTFVVAEPLQIEHIQK
jgi:hypothetical protein